MKKPYNCSLLFFLWFLPLMMSAQKNKVPYMLELQIVDYITSADIDGEVQVTLLNKDSVEVAKGEIHTVWKKDHDETYYRIPVDSSGNYILQCESADYHTLYQPIMVKLYKHKHIVALGKVRMKRKLNSEKAINLNGVEVVATKIKFYFNKDTLVYNAEPFVTQKGFVLNDILKKMPGIELRDDGNIYSNGEKVKALLLNGKDFFQNDRKTLLENLPAYIVKDVRIYNKKKDSLSVLSREREFEGLVMDVKLKKDYNINNMGNLDLGGGTDKRYYDKLFDMKFNNLYRLSAYAAMNNADKDEDINDSEYSFNKDSGYGDNKHSKAGLNYNADHSQGKYSVNGDVKLDYSDKDMDYKNNTQLFSTEGDVFTRSSKLNRVYNLNFSTSHEFNLWENTPYSIIIKPSFSHQRVSSNETAVKATFLTDTDRMLGNNWLDSLTDISLCQALRQYGVDRQIERTDMKGNVTEAKINVQKTIDFPHSDNKLTLSTELSYRNADTKTFLQNNIDYLSTTPSDHKWTYYYQNAKGINWNMREDASYVFKFSENNTLTAKLAYQHESDDTENPIYALHWIDGWSYLSPPFGSLPTPDVLSGVTDVANSNKYYQQNNNLTLNLEYEYIIKRSRENAEDSETSFFISTPVNFKHSRLHFTQNLTDVTLIRSMNTPDVDMSVVHNINGGEGLNWQISYKTTHEMPLLASMIDIHNDTNPLYITHGNSSLKNTVNHTVSFMAYWRKRLKWNHMLGATYKVMKDAIAQAMLFDKNTGVWNITPLNVNGNRSFSLLVLSTYYLPHSWTLRNNITTVWLNIANYSGMNMAEYAEKNLSHYQSISEELTIEKMSANTKYGGSLTAYVDYNHTTSGRANFVPLNNYDYGLKCRAHVEMPWNIRLDTDLTTVSRHGYSFSNINKSEYIWNANLEKSFSESITLKLEGSDILNQRSMVQRQVTAQMRSEDIYNHLKRYAMLHLIWKFSKTKKNK